MLTNKATIWATVAAGMLISCARGSSSNTEQGGANDKQGAAPESSGEPKVFPPGPSKPAPVIMLEPGDLTTSVGQSPLQVLVSNLGRPVGKELLEAIARSIKLVTWPEMTVVSTTIEQIEDASGKSDEDEFAHIVLKQNNRLDERWYALAVDRLAEGAAWPGGAVNFRAQGGATVSRFHIGSDPVVRGVYVAEKAAGVTVVDIEFSERVRGDARLAHLQDNGSPIVGCRPDMPTTVVPNNDPDVKRETSGQIGPSAGAGAESVKSVRLVCSHRLDMTRTMSLTIAPGFTSASGAAPLNRGAPVDLELKPSAWREAGDGQRLLIPPSP